MARHLFHIAAAALLLAAASLSCHHPGEEEGGEKPVPVNFSVNGQGKDAALEVSPMGGTATLTVFSTNPSWNVQLEADAEHPVWLVPGKAIRDRDKEWSLPLEFLSNEGEEERQAHLLFTCDTLHLRLLVRQSTLDPVLRNHVPGFYGVEGGDVTLDPAVQQSGLYRNAGGTISYRLMDVTADRVAVLTGLPAEAGEGDTVDLQYKVVENGLLTAYAAYPAVTVFHMDGDLIWLKGASSVYFIIER